MLKNTIQQKLFDSFQKYRDNAAIEYMNNSVTYLELDRKSDFFASCIKSKGISKGTFIGILTDNRLELISIIIGILKAGCVFVPLDSAYPLKRLELMIKSTDTKHIFIDKNNHSRLSDIYTDDGNKVETIIMDNSFYSKEDYQEGYSVEYCPDDAIYIYFTSGSTGIPKAILGRNKSLLHFVNWETETFNINCESRVSQFTSPGFDAFLRDVFSPLCSGGTVCIPRSREVILDTNSLIEWIEHSKVNIIHCTPSLFRVFNSDKLEEQNFKNLKYVLMAGERINPGELANWYNIFGERIQLVNLYGPSETTMVKLFYPIRMSDVTRKSIPVGKPMKGSKVIILDEDMNICSKGTMGQIYIRTPFMTHGYYKNPDATGEKFVKNPFNNDPNDIIYKTEDFGRLLPDENIEFGGRMDKQVKIRGNRIELGEVENIILQCSLIKEAIVIDKQSEDKEVYLCAYVVYRQEDLAGEGQKRLREYLSERLPDYMIPQYIIKIDKIPMTLNGKLDFRALPEPEGSIAEEYVEPLNEFEKRLEKVCCNILRVDKISVNKNLLELGGNSIKIMSIISKIEKDFNTKLQLIEVLKKPSIREIAMCIKKGTKGVSLVIEPTPESEHYKISPTQRSIYEYIRRYSGVGVAFNMPRGIIIEGNINREILEQAFKAVISRHEILRTSFDMVDNELVQKIHEDIEFGIAYAEPGKSERLGEDYPEAIVREFIRSFDIRKVPLIRVKLVNIEENKTLLLFDAHQIIIDASSCDILIREVFTLYNGEHLPEVKLQYKDYSNWHNRLLESDTAEEQNKYWQEKFWGEIPVLNIPSNCTIPENKSFEGNRTAFEASMEVASKVRKIALESHATMYMALLAVYKILLSKYSGQEEIIVSTQVTGRRTADVEGMIGRFADVVPIKSHIHKSESYREVLEDIKSNVSAAFENGDFKFWDIVDRISTNGPDWRNPLYDIMFSMQNAYEPQAHIENLNIRNYELKFNVSRFDIRLTVVESDKNLYFSLQYCTKIYKREFMDQFGSNFINILNKIAENPDVRLSEISIQ